MASPTQWTWVWIDSGSCWWTGRPGVLWFMGSQRVGHNRATELNCTEERKYCQELNHYFWKHELLWGQVLPCSLKAWSWLGRQLWFCWFWVDSLVACALADPQIPGDVSLPALNLSLQQGLWSAHSLSVNPDAHLACTNQDLCSLSSLTTNFTWKKNWLHCLY